MADFLDDCQDYFGTKSLYEVLGLPNKTATQAEITSAYRKTSLKVHPDRAPEDKKEHAKKAFQTLTKVHKVLSNEEHRKVYDESGFIVTEDIGDGFTTYEQYEQYWRTLFPKITTKKIDEFLSNYIGSDEEKEDLKKLFQTHKGNMNKIYETHFGFDDEDRIRSVIDGLIEAGEVEAFKAYTHEPAANRKKRAQKYAKEAKEAEKIKKSKKEPNDDDLILAIRGNQTNRLDSLISNLESKYGKKKASKKKAK